MHWGDDPVLEKHYVPRRSQRTRSVLTFFAEDASTHTLLYANADLAKASCNREVIAFADHWHQVIGRYPALLIFDSKLSTQAVPNLTTAASGSSPCAPATSPSLRPWPYSEPRPGPP